MKKINNKFFVLAAILGFILTFNQCVSYENKSTDVRGQQYSGSFTCKNCHATIYEGYLKTAHNLTSSAASKETIHGSFARDSNTYFYHDALKVVMEERDTGLYQVAYIDNQEQQAAPFDIVIGSGTKGQTYLYWYGNNIFQLPISYYAPESAWVNSPNFPPQQVRFDRNISIGCFECHSAYINKTSDNTDRKSDAFNRNQIIYGIDCERCHGPAALHVSFHEKHPEEKSPHNISMVTQARLSRDGNLDMCGVCHSGTRQSQRPTFYYKPGEKLSYYLSPDSSVLSVNDIDVHGKQYQLLKASQCFIKSKTLNCSSCHNPHVRERDNRVLFSQRCLSCHVDVKHRFLSTANTSPAQIVNNCIDCHMPARPSSIITMKSEGKTQTTPALVRTHFIDIYPEESNRELQKR